MKKYDVVVIGAGPGGYTCALELSKRGKKVALVEKGELGGVCLNEGCIPTKTFIHTVEFLHKMEKIKEYGVDVSFNSFNIEKLVKKKDKVISTLRTGIDYSLKKSNVDLIKAKAHVFNQHTVEIEDGEKLITENIVIATGSKEYIPSTFDPKLILTSRELLSLENLPSEIVIIGGGVIGCEFATILSFLGVKVTVIEALSNILPNMDKEVSLELQKFFKKRGIQILTSKKVVKLEKDKDNKIKIFFDDNSTIRSDRVMVAIGREPIIDKNIEKLGIETEKKGILIDEYCRTTVPSIYAIGDVTGKCMLAHVASFMGVNAARNICGEQVSINKMYIPECVYTIPQIAKVGLTEEEAKKSSKEVKIYKHFYRAMGKAHCDSSLDGFVKIIVDSLTQEILGVHIIGENATEIIGEMVLAMRWEYTPQELLETIHAHPTIYEILWETLRQSR